MNTPEPAAGPLRVAIAMLTFHRPDDLAAVVPLLLAQAADAELMSSKPVRVRVLIVDNDPQGSGRSTVESFTSDRLRYVVEPKPGIASARNRALDELADVDIVVFIDDDERPHDHWLGTLLELRERTTATAVAGPVISEFVGDLDPWVAAGAFFQRRRLPTGTHIEVAATNNLLLDLRRVRALGLRFDPQFGLSGADDTFFTRSLARRGALLVWCDEAIVTDVVPADRMTPRWVIARAFSSGNSWSLTSVALQSGPLSRSWGRLRAAGSGSTRLAAGAARYGFGIARRSAHHQTRGLRTLARGAGMIVGSAGLAYQEYGTAAARARRLRRVARDA